MITVCAGKLMPQANVAVQQSTLIKPCSNNCSVMVRSERSMPVCPQRNDIEQSKNSMRNVGRKNRRNKR